MRKNSKVLLLLKNVLFPYSHFLPTKHYWSQNPQGAAQEKGRHLRRFGHNAKLMAVTMQTFPLYAEAFYPPRVFLHLFSACSCQVALSQY